MSGVNVKEHPMSVTRTMSTLALAALLASAGGSGFAEPIKPTSRQLAALCDTCAVVTEVRVVKRKGKASGVGAAGGAVAGGVVGKQMGDSTGATVGGAVIGGVLGHQIERQLKKHKVWVVDGVRRDGTALHHEFEADPQLKAGDIVQPDGTGLKRR
jgi:uncharacterized protein YcfJ